MIKTFHILLAVLLLSVSAKAQSSINWKPFLQQTVLYFSSDRITMGGLGIGAGVQFVKGENLVAQTDASILWGNGNAVSTRLALGYQRDGQWTPAIFGSIGILWGQRTEVLSKTGRRPASPVWVLGLRRAFIRFEGSSSYVSALEFGYGIGPDHGVNLETTILSAGVRW